MPKTKTLSKPKSGKANRKKTSRRPRKGGLSLFGPKKELTPMEQKEKNLKRDIKLTERYIKEKTNQISSLTRRLNIAYHKKGQRKGRLGILRDISELPPRIEALKKQKKIGNIMLEQQEDKLRTLEEAARVEAEAARVEAEAARVEAEAAAAKAAEEAAPCPRCTDGTTANQCSDVVKALEERLAQAKTDLQAAVDR